MFKKDGYDKRKKGRAGNGSVMERGAVQCREQIISKLFIYPAAQQSLTRKEVGDMLKKKTLFFCPLIRYKTNHLNLLIRNLIRS